MTATSRAPRGDFMAVVYGILPDGIRLTFGYDTAHAGEVLGRARLSALGDGSVGADRKQHAVRGGVRCGSGSPLDFGCRHRPDRAWVRRWIRRRRPLAILLSHYHWDDVQGLPYFRPFFQRGWTVRILGPALRDANPEWLDTLFAKPHFPVSLDELESAPYMSFLEGATFTAGGFEVSALPLMHPGGSMAYRIKGAHGDLVYATDHEFGDARADAALETFAAGAAALVMDAQYTPEELSRMRGRGHGSWRQCVDLAAASGAGHLWLYHHQPGRTDQRGDGHRVGCAPRAVVHDRRARGCRVHLMTRRVLAGLLIGAASAILVLLADAWFVVFGDRTHHSTHSTQHTTRRRDGTRTAQQDTYSRNRHKSLQALTRTQAVAARSSTAASSTTFCAPAKLIAYDARSAPLTRAFVSMGDDTLSGAESDEAFAAAVKKAGNVLLLADATYTGEKSDTPAPPDVGFRLNSPDILERTTILLPYPSSRLRQPVSATTICRSTPMVRCATPFPSYARMASRCPRSA